MTMGKLEQVRSDLSIADGLLRICWDNFKATEPTYVLRDLIVIELQKAREKERDQCAAIALRLHGCDGDQIAAAIRERNNGQ